MAAVMFAPAALPRLQLRRCISLKDCRYPGTCAGIPMVLSPRGAPAGPVTIPPRTRRRANPSPRGHSARPPARCHSVVNMHFAEATPQKSPRPVNDASPRKTLRDASPQKSVMLVPGRDASPAPVRDASPQKTVAMDRKRNFRRAKTLGAQISSDLAVAVVAPGGGTGINSSVYSALARKDDFSVEMLGQSRALYDRYPMPWAKEGSPAPNLESFALDLLADTRLEHADCLVVGSRGGQVVLPTLWKNRGADVPPAVVMNGGCAMGLPIPVHWPESSVTFLLIGGNDYFRGNMGAQEYLEDALRHVPQANQTTAILLVHEMLHMPQAELLMATLQHMIRAVTSWKSTDCVPVDDFNAILGNLRRGGWSGKLTYKTGMGESWKSEAFP